MIDFYNDKKIVISLKHRTDRRDHITKQFENMQAKNYEIMDALDANFVSTMSKWFSKFPPEIVACKMSHAYAIVQAMEEGLEHVIILEDDALFCDQFENKLAKALNQLPANWEMFHLGGNNYHKPLQMLTDNIGQCQHTLAPVCYVVKNTVYNKILEDLAHDDILDLIYATKTHHQLNAYCAKPSLVTQYASYSDIEKRFIDYSSIAQWN